MALVDNKYYMMFAWGMQKHAQLGLGDIGSPCSNPRPITYLQDVMIYNVERTKYLIKEKKIFTQTKKFI